jgi:uncharacterized protein YdhG (YjbR/CyaY superfamily)
MKKTAAGGAPKSVDEYLAGVPEPARATLSKVREAIRAAAPQEATEGFSYGVPAFLFGKPLMGYVACRSHCSLYPMSGRVIETLRKELAGYETTSGAIHFPLAKPLPASLVKKLVKARLAEIEHGRPGRAAGRGGSP